MSRETILQIAFVLAMLFAFSGPASAAIYYMSSTGSDGGSGAIGSPWLTVGFASSQLVAGDTLYARGGTYTQSGQSWSSPSGTSSLPITWKAYPGEIPIFDGQNGNTTLLNIVAMDWLIIDGLTVKNYKGCCSGIWIGYSGSGSNYAENNIIRNCTFDNIGNDVNEHAIYVSYGNVSLTVNNNIMKNISGYGIHGWHGPGIQGGKFFNNLIVDCGGSGIVAADGANNIEIYNNTIVSCTGYALALYGGQGETSESGTSNVTVRNNIFASNTETALITDAVNHTYSHNLSFGTATLGTNAVSGDPLFISSTDHHLQTGSPAKDAGSSAVSGIVTTDLDSIASRPQGSAYDIGAYELFVGSGGALTAHWKLDDASGTNAADSSAGTSPGTLVGSPVWTSGIVGGALTLDGVNDQITTTKLASVFLSVSTGTMTVWLRPSGTAPPEAQVYDLPAVTGDASGYIGIRRGINTGLDRIWAFNYDTTSDVVGVTYAVNEWIHIGWKHSGGNLSIYKNGVPAGSVASGDSGEVTSLFSIGKAFSPGFYQGLIDDLRVYNTALTDAQIRAIYDEVRFVEVFPPRPAIIRMR